MMKIDIRDYARIINGQLCVTYNPGLGNGSWQSSFERCEISIDGCFLKGESGGGKTPDEAIKSYAQAISGKRIVFNAMDKGTLRREFDVPELTYKEK